MQHTYWLPMMVVVGLCLVACIGLSGLIACGIRGHECPREIGAITASAVGSLGAILVRLPIGRDAAAAQTPEPPRA